VTTEQDGGSSGFSADMAEDDSFQPLPQRVATLLREKILLEEFPPGSVIPERETAAALGVSRTPLREALRLLGNEGLVDIRAARSPVVTDPSPDELRGLYAVMRVLEGLAGELACKNATVTQLAEIRAAHEALKAINPACDPLDFLRGDQAFHDCILVAAENPALAKTHGEYNARLWRARFMPAKIGANRERVLDEHALILEGIEARDTRAAANALEMHLRSAAARLPLGAPSAV